MPSRGRPMFVLVAIAAMVLAAVPALASDGPPSDPPPQMLDQPRHGEDAIRALGERLPDAAALNDLAPSEFRQRLRQDLDVWVDRGGRLFVRDTGLVAAVGTADEAALTSPATYPYDDTFRLHSRPGADRVIYLDFDGHLVSGTAWNDGSDLDATPYDTDGNPASFSQTEMDVVQDVWRRVAEDYAPFDVDVTTEDPGVDAINRSTSSDQQYGTRALITDMDPLCSCGGVAYVGVFDLAGSHDYYQPAWIFTQGVGHGAKYIAEATSHEVGHNLGLSHDGRGGDAYYYGHGDWAPIMGVGYYAAITQWSMGDYSGATNREDDVLVMQASGAPLRPDDHGDTAADATDLGATLAATGRISTRSDVDTFVVTAGAGTASITATPAALGPNLDLALTLYDADGAVVGSANGSSLGADLSVSLAGGTYTLVVEGVGAGDPDVDGYSDYGSLGVYRLSGTLPSGDGGGSGGGGDPVLQPPAAPSDVSAQVSGATVTVAWTDNATDETGFEIVREKQNKRGNWSEMTLVGTVGADVTSFDDAPGGGTYRYSVRAVNTAGTSAYVVSNTVDVAKQKGGSGGGGGGKGGGKGGPKK